ncbi:hypothetical protein H257_02008 [Aphanomyces astaci]|uniref:Uncharacterized protein n=1 Tax=Aphanomyces astaci TaxID=112090 RepID=W4H5Y2_APHAT|nr:hypothetical protein H257_02008 [Aphanomyces astaci]ETV86991.1 hypothetical protein H257_02008 [Aphanomyces astaci]|eukprot:XP_009823790.1 hypothetical protein H257_02008 [Aphanomyces astaci]
MQVALRLLSTDATIELNDEQSRVGRRRSCSNSAGDGGTDAELADVAECFRAWRVRCGHHKHVLTWVMVATGDSVKLLTELQLPHTISPHTRQWCLRRRTWNVFRHT